jgi:antirestriction protein ArdC
MGHVDDGLELIETVIAAYPNSLTISKVDTGECCYRPGEDKLVLPQNHLDHFQQTVHELVHSTGHPSRLNRWNVQHPPTDRERAIEEIIADMGSLEFFQRLNMLQKQFYYEGKTTSIRGFFGDRINNLCKQFGISLGEGSFLEKSAKEAVDYLMKDINL